MSRRNRTIKCGTYCSLDGLGDTLALQSIPFISVDADDLVHSALSAIDSKNLRSLRNALEVQPSLVEYTNELGITLLETAVEAGWIEGTLELASVNEEGVSTRIYQALLMAIRYNKVDIVRICLEKLSDLNNAKQNGVKFAKFLQRLACQAGGKGFTDDEEVSPMALAIHHERHHIIKYLHDRGLELDLHPVSEIQDDDDSVDSGCPNGLFSCAVCEGATNKKFIAQLGTSRRIIAAYRSLVSPYHVLRESIRDPILEAFLISYHLDWLQKTDIVFAKKYKELSQESRLLAIEWLDLCRTEKEVCTLFSCSSGVSESDCNMELPRLHLAVDYGQKEFIAHPHYQYALQEEWYKGLPQCFASIPFRQAVLLFLGILCIFCMPVISILYMLSVHCVVQQMRVPITRFVNDTCSYLCFLALIFVDTWTKQNSMADKLSDWPSHYQWLIFIWVLAMCARSVRKFYKAARSRGFRKSTKKCRLFLRSCRLWIFYDPVMRCLFIASFLCGLVTGIITRQNMMEDLPRYRWSGTNPKLFGEAMFAVASWMAFIRLCVLFVIFSKLGPLLISLGHMIGPVFRYFVVYATVYTAFVVSLVQLYSPYRGGQRFDPDLTDNRTQVEGFTSVHTAYKTLFWSLFNYGDEKFADVVVSNCGSFNRTGNSTRCGEDVVKHKMTEGVGYLLFAAFHITAIIILLNLFIATMANCYTVIELNSDKEWKFHRARVMLKLAYQAGKVPPPYNLLGIIIMPGVKLVKWIVRRIRTALGCKCCRTWSAPSWRATDDRKHSENQHLELVKTLKTRYWYRKRKIVDSLRVGTMESQGVRNSMLDLRQSMVGLAHVPSLFGK